MKTQDRFVRAVGRMPFSGKHDVRRFYVEGVRASHYGDAETRDFSTRRVGQFALANAMMGLSGAVMAGLSMRYGMGHDALLQFLPDAVGASLYSAGHTASAVAQWIMRQRLCALPMSPEPSVPPVYDTSPTPQPTVVERVVTNGGTVAVLLPAVHAALHSLITQA